jgi:hypothetical protein
MLRRRRDGGRQFPLGSFAARRRAAGALRRAVAFLFGKWRGSRQSVHGRGFWENIDECRSVIGRSSSKKHEQNGAGAAARFPEF